MHKSLIFGKQMSRLWRYLRRLSGEEWADLYAAAQSELAPISRSLLFRLREALAPPPLSTSEKVLAQRIERWLWRKACEKQYTHYPTYKVPPPLWLQVGAELYYAKGLHAEASALLMRARQQGYYPLYLLFQEAQWSVEQGQLKKADALLCKAQKLCQTLWQNAQRSRLQLLLSRLFYEHGGSFTPSARQVLERLATLKRWQSPLPESPLQRVAEKNLRGTWSLLQGDILAALHWYQPEPTCPEPLQVSLHLNRWLAHIYQESPPTEIEPILAALSPSKLSPFDRSVYAERIWLTLLRYGHPSEIETILPFAEQLESALDFRPLSHTLLFLQLKWLIEGKTRWIHAIHRIAQQNNATLSEKWQASLLSLLLAAEERDTRLLIYCYKEFLRYLRKTKGSFASVPILRKLAYYLYETRLSEKALAKAAQTWEAHLTQFPAEKYFWLHTLLPDWLQARKERIPLRQYRWQKPAHQSLATTLRKALQK
jgi:hypothetical protein